MAVILRLPNSV